jgi:hypothetical protein
MNTHSCLLAIAGLLPAGLLAQITPGQLNPAVRDLAAEKFGRYQVPAEAVQKLSAAQAFADRSGVTEPKTFNQLVARALRLSETEIRIDGNRPQAPSDFGAANFALRTTTFDKFIRIDGPGSLAHDAIYNANLKRLIELTQRGERILGGKVTGPYELLDCVAIGDSTHYFATGTLIGEQLVLSAVHVAKRGLPKKVFIGHNLNVAGGGREVAVASHHAQTAEAIGPDTPEGLLLLVLAQKVTDVLPRRLPPTPMPANYPWDETDAGLQLLRIAGFGADSADGKTGFGIKRLAEVPTAGRLPQIYGFNPETEFAAGFDDLGIDSCKGDSGGPALVYLPDAQDWFLVGCTSRSTTSRDGEVCGDGGIYLRADTQAARDWIARIAQQKQVRFP